MVAAVVVVFESEGVGGNRCWRGRGRRLGMGSRVGGNGIWAAVVDDVPAAIHADVVSGEGEGGRTDAGSGEGERCRASTTG